MRHPSSQENPPAVLSSNDIVPAFFRGGEQVHQRIAFLLKRANPRGAVFTPQDQPNQATMRRIDGSETWLPELPIDEWAPGDPSKRSLHYVKSVNVLSSMVIKKDGAFCPHLFDFFTCNSPP
jgi:hypothetical protein